MSKAEVDKLMRERDLAHTERTASLTLICAASAALAGYRFGSRREPEAILEGIPEIDPSPEE